MQRNRWTKLYPKVEYADYYRVGGLKKLKAAEIVDEEASEPWIGEGMTNEPE